MLLQQRRVERPRKQYHSSVEQNHCKRILPDTGIKCPEPVCRKGDLLRHLHSNRKKEDRPVRYKCTLMEGNNPCSYSGTHRSGLNSHIRNKQRSRAVMRLVKRDTSMTFATIWSLPQASESLPDIAKWFKVLIKEDAGFGVEDQ
ncbi:hypothetical protein NLI96_g12255 [Meripilus lineatus]|uniref:Uncharacterized protein n=1 Tax=Meripilus lineatus TaxID=2056292 RepID=A0AAD5UQF0_9APHY|nr:hypothetical protein NLI96_g12255 [Physisporinus lineatus]